MPKGDLDRIRVYLAEHGTARSGQIGEALGISPTTVTALLAAPASRGEIVARKVSVPGGRDQNEYRLGSGLPVRGEKPLRTRPAPGNLGAWPARPTSARADGAPHIPVFLQQGAQPAVAKNTGSQPGVPTPGLPHAPGLAVAEKAPAANAERRGSGPAPQTPPVRHETAPSGPAMRFAIDSDGALTLDLADGQSDPLRLTAAETLALGDFLICCEGVWRP